MCCLVLPYLWSKWQHLRASAVPERLPSAASLASQAECECSLSVCAQVFGLLLAVCLGSFVSALGAVLMLWL